jgi:hypothetical protein
MESNWEIQKLKSNYHFKNDTIDSEVDKIENIGRFIGDWSEEIEGAIKNSKPVSWRNRSKTGNPNSLVDAEEHDLRKIGADVNMIVSNLNYNLSPIFQKMVDIIGLGNAESRVHVQWPGQVFVKHIDKLEKFYPKDPSKVSRIMILLTDYDQGHFNQYGNFMHQFWKSGDIVSFDWMNLPHSSANAGLSPRVSLLTTGVITETTKQFFKEAKNGINI